ncbi:MAG: AraC family transcriptional regulator, partial [Oscillospiraceae bacterium]|nr:AraC family transcriptional regulator [Oscillospiraceae bacterium]
MDQYVMHKIDTIFNITDIVTVYYLELAKDYVFGGEKHDFWEMVYVDKGEIVSAAEEKEYLLRENELIFYKPNEFHAISTNGSTPANIFVISFVCKSKQMEFFKERKMKLPAKLKRLISNIIDESTHPFVRLEQPSVAGLKISEDSKAIGTRQLTKIYMEQLLIMLVRNQEEPKKNKNMFASREDMENNLVKEIIAYLEGKIYSTVTIEEICEHLHYGRTLICNIFKDVTDYTIMQYYTMLKIAEAKMLIRQKNYNFGEISDMLSFGSPYYFSKTFK